MSCIRTETDGASSINSVNIWGEVPAFFLFVFWKSEITAMSETDGHSGNYILVRKTDQSQLSKDGELWEVIQREKGDERRDQRRGRSPLYMRRLEMLPRCADVEAET